VKGCAHGCTLGRICLGRSQYAARCDREAVLRLNYLIGVILLSLVLSEVLLAPTLANSLEVLMAALLAAPDRRRQTVFVLATLFSTAAGIEVLHLLNSSNFYRLVKPGNRPSLHDFATLIWWQGRIPKELRELAHAWRRDQIILGYDRLIKSIA